MSLEILDQLEGKIRQAVETIQLLQLEVEELKEKNNQVQYANEALRNENEQLKVEHNNWQERLRSLLGQIDNV
ncbi:MAG: cell division protein ZapB [[Actinobacillus] rossii]|uniref:Cell division protein ZapB n=1 Tax=[Actinobacillus] rossii TaxID=123820 RepID=A0A380TPA1_9PAST|nr:cell division protein ZapB [[Actinobacillus] rossii]MDD7426280.1 cell division protein ZapB [[Actinobacillus] rossii]MDD7568507.1 cell division protein ZapB [[Actinobacillus] rossii]MDY3124576.1 cell division protein ZapB [[Actinobacillus] rossii]MDY4505572.1 cell division protein ZapB [[Actinobacillus] rossii]